MRFQLVASATFRNRSASFDLTGKLLTVFRNKDFCIGFEHCKSPKRLGQKHWLVKFPEQDFLTRKFRCVDGGETKGALGDVATLADGAAFLGQEEAQLAAEGGDAQDGHRRFWVRERTPVISSARWLRETVCRSLAMLPVYSGISGFSPVRGTGWRKRVRVYHSFPFFGKYKTNVHFELDLSSNCLVTWR
jgi:hypothetical protein